MKRIKFRLTAYTDAAGRRTDTPPLYGNEDNFFVDADLSNEQCGEFINDERLELSEYGSLLVIADGMGGMNAGEVASDIAIQTVKKYFTHNRLSKKIIATPKSRENYMESVVAEADAAIKTYAKGRPECEGMGSTMIMVWVCNGKASITWCGDSRAYLFREPIGIEQISIDHSYVQSLVNEGKITEDEAFDHPYGNVVTRSLGDPEKRAQADSLTIPLYKGDIILVCSDGLSGVLRDHKSCDPAGNPRGGSNLEDIIRDNRASLQKCREVLWDAAKKAGWYDNVTAILYEVTDGEAAPKNISTIHNRNSSSDLKTKSIITIKISKKTVLYAIILILVVILLVCSFLITRSLHHEIEPEEEIDTTIDSPELYECDVDPTTDSIIEDSTAIYDANYGQHATGSNVDIIPNPGDVAAISDEDKAENTAEDGEGNEENTENENNVENENGENDRDTLLTPVPSSPEFELTEADDSTKH